MIEIYITVMLIPLFFWLLFSPKNNSQRFGKYLVSKIQRQYFTSDFFKTIILLGTG
jgi:hypothetical protein